MLNWQNSYSTIQIVCKMICKQNTWQCHELIHVVETVEEHITEQWFVWSNMTQHYLRECTQRESYHCLIYSMLCPYTHFQIFTYKHSHICQCCYPKGCQGPSKTLAQFQLETECFLFFHFKKRFYTLNIYERCHLLIYLLIYWCEGFLIMVIISWLILSLSYLRNYSWLCRW